MHGYYLRHAFSTCQANKVDGTRLFNMDASFNPIAMPDGTFKFQSVNYPDCLLSHDGNRRVKIMRHANATDTNTFIEDAQWIMTKVKAPNSRGNYLNCSKPHCEENYCLNCKPEMR